MIPLPGIIVDAVTGPLKQWISAIVVELLYYVGYPISRNGVVLTIGQYQMLVADACSGLHSMYSLSALGTLFMYIMARRSTLHNAIMLASILPIAFVANIVRVIALVLITYHLGDEAGQGFLHGAAGIVLMLVALVCFFALDALLARILGGRRKPAAGRRRARHAVSRRAPAVVSPLSWRRVSAGTAASKSAANFCCIANARGGVAVDRRDAKQQPVGDLAGQGRARISAIRLSKVLLDHLVADGQPIGHRLVARTQGRRQAAHLDRRRSRSASAPSSMLPSLKPCAG